MKRFWDKVNKSSSVFGDDGQFPTQCWTWTAGVSNKGYGLFWLSPRMQSSHRVAWFLEWGNVPKEICVLHKCDNKICVRPDHLFLGTVQDNNNDKKQKNRSYYGIQKSENQPTAKLTRKDVTVIRARFATGETQRSIALDYDVGYKTIHKVVRNKSWKSI